MEKLNFMPGVVIVQTNQGPKLVTASFFDWNGVTLAVTSLTEDDEYVITHPESGLRVPGISEANPEAAYQKFIESVPKINRILKGYNGKTLKEFLLNASKNSENIIENAKEKFRENSATVTLNKYSYNLAVKALRDSRERLETLVKLAEESEEPNKPKSPAYLADVKAVASIENALLNMGEES